MNQILINSGDLQTQLAIVKDGSMQDYYLERNDSDRIVGSIYKGRLSNLEPSLQATFIDIGLEKNAFLHYWDMLPTSKESWENNESFTEFSMDKKSRLLQDQESVTEESVSQGKIQEEKGFTGHLRDFFTRFFNGDHSRSTSTSTTKRKGNQTQKTSLNKRRGKNRYSLDDIPKRFSINSDITVQVSKGVIGDKGPRVTTNLSIPGRYVVLLPNAPHKGVSRRIDNRKEGQRLRNLLHRIELPKGMGCIFRTASMGLCEKVLQEDIESLIEQWKEIEKKLKTQRAPVCIYQEPNFIGRTVRDWLSDDIDEIVVDSKSAFDLISKEAKRLIKQDRTKIKLYRSRAPIFRHYKLERQIETIFCRRVKLASGAEFCIDETEAMIAIDVNSGKSRLGKDHSETILNTNLEAAEEIVRQLRLRNIGGLVVVDFIDMRSKKDQMQVYHKMKEALSCDRAKTKIYPISRLGLLEMTRQRECESLQERISEPCQYCKGKGLIKSSMTVSMEIQQQLREFLGIHSGVTDLRVMVHPTVFSRLKDQNTDMFDTLEKEFHSRLSFRVEPTLHQEEFKFIDPKTGRSFT